MLLCQNALAHQQKSASTIVLLNERTQVIEISHRLFMHDAEHVMQYVTGKALDIHSNEQSKQQLAEYVAEHFFIDAGTNDTPKLIGSEIEGKFFWVYQLLPLPDSFLKQGSITLTIHDSILMEHIPSQLNMVYVEYENSNQALIFDQQASRKLVTVNAEQ